MIKISKENLEKVFDRLSSAYPLYLPIKKAGEVNYGMYQSGVEVSLDTIKTNKSPKDVFFPQSEDLMKFKVDGQKIEIIDIREEAKPFIVMGVKACDYKAFDVLDNVFLYDPKDSYYETKRSAGIIFTQACYMFEESCFCTVFGIDPSNPLGDVTMFNLAGDFVFRANTEKGQACLNLFEDLSEKADDKVVEAQQKYILDTVKKLPLSSLSLKGFDEDTLKIFNSPKWNQLSEACLGCGSCTFVCPTCQCFDIREFVGNGDVKRFRCWDSCMFKDFTKTAGGQPRPTQMQRYRQRFMHKLKYYPENNNGLYSCVGCGRCIKKCPQHLNIAKVIKEFNND